jgi:hypothetical protein
VTVQALILVFPPDWAVAVEAIPDMWERGQVKRRSGAKLTNEFASVLQTLAKVVDYVPEKREDKTAYCRCWKSKTVRSSTRLSSRLNVHCLGVQAVLCLSDDSLHLIEILHFDGVRNYQSAALR